MEELHKPVLLSEVLRTITPKVGENYLDLTAGYGGHAKSILDVTRNYKDSMLVDRDINAINYLQQKFAGKAIDIRHEDFYSAARQEIECGKTYDLILADFGVSSPQLDRPERGFTFKTAGPLDMRMDSSQNLTAERVVNHYSERELVQILEKYGEISARLAEKQAKIIVHGRPWQDTKQLADAIAAGGRVEAERNQARNKRRAEALAEELAGRDDESASGEISHRRGTHPATRVFQAIRIEVNDELGIIERTLPLIPKLLNPGGRVAIITFHSLEDRLVKNYFREASARGEESELRLLNKKPIVAENMELVINPRARSASLRAAIRTSD